MARRLPWACSLSGPGEQRQSRRSPPEEAAGEPSPSFLQRQVKTDSELGVAPPAAARRPSFVQRRLSMFAVGRRSSESRTAPDPEGGRRSSSDWTPPARTAKMEGTVEMAVEDA